MKEGEKEMSVHRETVNNSKIHMVTQTWDSVTEVVTPPNLVTGFVVVNIGNSANNDVNSPDTDTCFHVLD